MKTYSVKEIAEILKTNPETVRRWIRDGKLNAVISSKKDGSVVYESDFNKFLVSAPKYARIAGQSAAAIPALGIPALVLGITGTIFESIVDRKIDVDARILPEEAIRHVKKQIKVREGNIKIYETNIKKKEKEIEVLREEIKAEEQQIEQFKLLLQHTDGEAEE